jgi:hypothetical protein
MASKRNFSERQLATFNAYLKALVSHVAKYGKIRFDSIRREFKTTGLTLEEFDFFELYKYYDNPDEITREVSDSIRYAIREKELAKRDTVVEVHTINVLRQTLNTLEKEIAKSTAIQTEIPPIATEEPKKSLWNRFLKIVKK